MAKKQRDAVNLPQISSAIVIGGLVAFGVCVACTAGAAWLIYIGRVDEGAMSRVASLATMLGTFVGGWYAARNSGCKMLLSAVGSALVYCFIWLTLAMVLYRGASLSAAGAYLATSLAGGVASGLLSATLR